MNDKPNGTVRRDWILSVFKKMGWLYLCGGLLVVIVFLADYSIKFTSSIIRHSQASLPFNRNPDYVTIRAPSNLLISDDVILDDVEDFTVSGKISNVGDTLWSSVTIGMNAYTGDYLFSGNIHSCHVDLTDLLPGTSQDFQVSCNYLENTSSIDNLRYTLSAAAGYKPR